MALTKLLGIFLIIGVVSATPVENKDEDNSVFDESVFDDCFVKYTAQDEIVRLITPLDSVKFSEKEDDTNIFITLYFVVAGVKEHGKKEYKGLYSLRNGVVSEVLQTGTDASSINDETNDVYFSATDGIYKYDGKTQKVEKYGSITESFIGILKPNVTDTLYVLTENHEIYKVTDGGNKKEKLDAVEDAQQFILDYADSLYYYGKDKVPYVITAEGPKKVVGLPANPSYVQLVRPLFVMEKGVPFISDQSIYTLFPNGTSEITDFVVKVQPTAYAPEGTLIQYYAYNKKIYEYNILKIIVESGILKELDALLESKEDEIQSIKTRAKEEFKA